MIDVPLINEWTARTHTRRFRTEHRRDQGLIKEFYGGAAMDQSGYLLHDSLTPQIEVLARLSMNTASHLVVSFYHIGVANDCLICQNIPPSLKEVKAAIMFNNNSAVQRF